MTVPAGAGTPVAAPAPSQVELERRLYRRQRGRRSIVVSVVSGIISIIMMLLGYTAVGLWMRQFNVPAWGRDEDPLPVTTQSAAPGEKDGPAGA